jgi:hypothetical protein
MRIEIRGRTYDLQSDDNSWQVAEVKENKKGDKYLTGHVYLSTIESVADHLFQFSLRKADVKNLEELSSAAFDIRMEVRREFDL